MLSRACNPDAERIETKRKAMKALQEEFTYSLSRVDLIHAMNIPEDFEAATTFLSVEGDLREIWLTSRISKLSSTADEHE